MRFKAPIDGFTLFASISEIVELVTPARLASSRCERLWRERTKRSRPPTSTDILHALVLPLLNISKRWRQTHDLSRGWKCGEKDLMCYVDRASTSKQAGVRKLTGAGSRRIPLRPCSSQSPTGGIRWRRSI